MDRSTDEEQQQQPQTLPAGSLKLLWRLIDIESCAAIGERTKKQQQTARAVFCKKLQLQLFVVCLCRTTNKFSCHFWCCAFYWVKLRKQKAARAVLQKTARAAFCCFFCCVNRHIDQTQFPLAAVLIAKWPLVCKIVDNYSPNFSPNSLSASRTKRWNCRTALSWARMQDKCCHTYPRPTGA